ncbi:MAG: DNA topoisomerase 3 [Muribaculaceae bacterium]|nr:DNA topoisomerase 3 [Muribaculaceae bacterium]
MIVCITEKPSVAKDIAAILGAEDKRNGFYEGNGYQITWTFGHLCTLKEPNDYSARWKAWSLGALPMIPERFGIKLIDDPGIIRQFKVIETLIKDADEVINCGDAGQEGELIQRWVMQKANCNKPVKRLWISSLTDESIREGFKDLKPEADFDSLYYAGLSRAIGDWILGMNATRLYTLKYSQNRNVLSIGRVQTPTLALIVNRQLEILNFVPEDYWEVKTIYREVTFNATKGRYSNEIEAQEALKAIENTPLTITDITTKKGKEAPPRLFDLTSLQVECNRKYSFSADETLKLIQSLYEKKVATYPRVDTTYLSEDIYPKVPSILEALKPYANLTAPVLASKIPKSKKVFDNSKVTDHHAIIPTNVEPSRVPLSGDEKRVYDMIAKRFIAAFYPDCEFAATTVTADVNKIGFKANGKQILLNGWRDVYRKDQQTENEEANSDNTDQVMPEFIKGESGQHSPSLLKKATTPPKMYTEGTLLRAMETAGKFVEDEELREAMKENGIGRPSTRAAIIELLLRRRYIKKERKSLVATPAGIALIATIKEKLLKSAKLTGLWENKLRRIERNEYSASTFIDELKSLISEIVFNVLSDNSLSNISIDDDDDAVATKEKEVKEKKPRKPRTVTAFDKIKCPLCKKGHILKGRSAFGCSEYKNGCKLILPFSEYPESLTPDELSKKLKK